MSDGVLNTIGNTPLVPLQRLYPDTSFRLFAKIEAGNLGGSIKDRAAYSMLKRAMERGEVGPGATVIESSSGNMGIGLAWACLYFGLRFICVVDPKTTTQNINILKVYGAEVDVVRERDPSTGEYLQARLRRVEELLRTIPGSFWPNQYANLDNSLAHHGTMAEILDALDGQVDYLFLAASTCGTVRGCADFVAEHRLPTKIIAVDAVGSVIFGGERANRLIPGHGAAVRPALYRDEMAERCVRVTDRDCVVGCHRLLRREAILAGGSSGAVVSAVGKMSEEIPSGSTCVAVLCDRGERYLDTIFSEPWLESSFGAGSDRLLEVEPEVAVGAEA